MKGPYVVAITPSRKLSLRNVRWQMRDVSWELWPEDLRGSVLDRDFLVRLGGVSVGPATITLQLWPFASIGLADVPIYSKEYSIHGPDDAGGAEAVFRVRDITVQSGAWYDATVLFDGRWLGSCLLRIHAHG